MKLIHESLILGSVALDTIETKYGKAENLLGGSAMYATIASGLYGDAIPVGIVGDDFPKDGLGIFKKFSKNLKDLDQQPGGTFKWGGKYHEHGDDRDTLFTDLGVFENFNPSIHTSNKNASWLFLANIHPSLQLSVFEQCTNSPLVVTDTMNLWIDIASKELLDVMKKVDIVVLNDGEIKLLADDSNLVRAGNKVRGMMNGGILIIKKGEHGVLAIHPDGLIALPAYPTETVVDPTGCGDTFAGTLASRLALGSGKVSLNELKFALIHATVTASFTLQSFGVNALNQLEEEDYTGRIESYMEMTGTGK